MSVRVMVAAGTRRSRETTLTYVRAADRATFSGAVDATNIEIFRDLLALLPTDDDVVVSIADLELRVPEASSLLIETARALKAGQRLILTSDGIRPGPPTSNRKAAQRRDKARAS
jgi:hypothetical protein